MSSFSQWLASVEKKPQPKQFTWVCGSEQVLVEEIVQQITEQLQPAEWNHVQMIVGEESERAIWNEMDQLPAGKSNRLVIIRSAERLKNFERLEEFVKHRASNPRTHVVFVSGEAALPRLPLTPDQKRDRVKPALADHLRLLDRGKGNVIECRPYTQATAKHAITWVKSKVSMRDGIAGHLLERSNGDLRLVRDTCRKLSSYKGEIQLSTINGMLSERPRDNLADALLALDKRTALLALERLDSSEYSRVIGFLDQRLELAGRVHDMLTEHKTTGEIMRAVGNQSFLVPDILPIAKHYDWKRRDHIRNVLATADEALRGGNTVGVVESVIALW